jgi:DNA invertase Pin-like site-specific DNA recombinase
LAVCEAHGAILASVTEPLDTSSPMGEAVASLLVTFARLESQ